MLLKGLGRLLRDLWLKFDRDWGWNLARMLAFTIIQAIFGAIGFELIVLSLVLRTADPELERMLLAQLTALLPEQIGASAVASFEQSLRDASLPLLLLALPLTLWYASRFFVVLESTLAVIFERRQRPFLSQNAIALALMVLFSALVPVVAYSATLRPRIISVGSSHAAGGVSIHATIGASPADVLFSTLLSLAADFVMLALIYALLTPGRLALRVVWPGALVAAILVQLYVLIFPVYIQTFLRPDRFGSVAGFVLVLVVFFFAYGVFIVVGAELAALQLGYKPAPEDLPAILADVRKARAAARERVPA